MNTYIYRIFYDFFFELTFSYMMYLSLLYVAVLISQITPPFYGGTQIQQPWLNMP